MVNELVLRDSDAKTINLNKEEAEQVEETAKAKKIIEVPLTQKIENNSSSQPVYIGKALPGTEVGSAGWQIQKITYSGGVVTDVQWASGTSKFDKVWDDRASYSYS